MSENIIEKIKIQNIEYELGTTINNVSGLQDALDSKATENFVMNKIAEAELSGNDVDLSGYATKDEIPTKTSQLTNDSGYLTEVPEGYAKTEDIPTKPEDIGALPADTVIPTVPTNVSAFTNDAGYLTEHQDISGKLDASALPTAINTALAQAKASGEFDGKDGSAGKDGTSVTVKSVSESAEDGGSNVVTFSDGKTVTIKNGKTGATGGKGADGKTPVKGTDYYTEVDKTEMVNAVLAALPTWTGGSY